MHRDLKLAEEGALDEKRRLLDGKSGIKDTREDGDHVQWYASGRKYSKRELFADRCILVLGSIFSLVACPLIIVHAMQSHAEDLRLVAIVIYCVGLVFMLNASLIYHWNANKKEWATLLLFSDQFGIYLMICGTYTPLCIHTGAYFLLGAVWLLLVVGITLKVVCYGREHPWKATTDMLGFFMMGLSVLPFLPQVSPYISAWAMWRILFHGVVYSIGAFFLACRRLEFHYVVWHMCVFAAVVTFYVVAYREFAVSSPQLAYMEFAERAHRKLHLAQHMLRP